MSELDTELTGRIENWFAPLIPDKDGNFVLSGYIYDDAKGRWEDGHWITTSTIKDVDVRKLKEGDIITTRNSKYLLGKLHD